MLLRFRCVDVDTGRSFVPSLAIWNVTLVVRDGQHNGSITA
jgi:hypothetical protein